MSANTFQGTKQFSSIQIGTVFHNSGAIWIKVFDDRANKIGESGPTYFINAESEVDLNVTPAMLADLIKHSMWNMQLVALLYEARDLMFERLLQRNSFIRPADLESMDRTGRCKIASDLWERCNSDAQNALLQDPHHFVRSCAELSKVGFKAVNPTF